MIEGELSPKIGTPEFHLDPSKQGDPLFARAEKLGSADELLKELLENLNNNPDKEEALRQIALFTNRLEEVKSHLEEGQVKH